MPDTRPHADTRPPWRIRFAAAARAGLALIFLAFCGYAVVWAAIHLHEILSVIIEGAEQFPAIILPAAAIWIYQNYGPQWISNRRVQCQGLIRSFSIPGFRQYVRQLGGLIVHAPVAMGLILPLPYVVQHVLTELTAEPVFPFERLVEEIGDRTQEQVHRVGTDLIAAQFEDPPGHIRSEIMRAMDSQGFTSERAALLDRLANESPQTEHYIARFPVLFESADLGPSEESGEAQNIADVEFSEGVQYDPATNAFVIGNLVSALAPCAGTGPDRVILRVEGYASSQPFRNDDGNVMPNSDELNVHLANERRRVVEDVLNQAIVDEGVQERIVLVEMEDYASLEQMIAHREFDDRPSGQDAGTEAPPQDIFTRAAHIKVLDPGMCAINR